MTSNNKLLSAYLTPEDEQLAKTIATSMYRYDNVANNRLPTLGHMTDEHVKQFWEQGYLVVDQVLSEAEIRQSIDALMDIIHGRNTQAKLQIVKPAEGILTDEDRELAARKVSEYIGNEPRLAAIANHQAITGALSKLFGEPAKIVQDMAILKPPTGGAEKPWHQDMAYGPLAYNKSVVGIWIALDPAELDNGCMHVIPRSHMSGATPHYAVRDWQLCDINVSVEQDVAVPLDPGGALLFSGLLHHGTPPNFSTKRRRALQHHYAPESAVKLTPQEYKKMFTNEMTGAEC